MLKSSQRAWHQHRRTAKVTSSAVLVALLLGAAPVRADSESPDDTVFRDNTEQVLRGAATLAGTGCQGGSGVPMVLALLARGEQEHLWKLEVSDRALPLSPGLLKRVKDSSGVRIDDAAFESEAYCEAVFKSSLVSLGAFANSAHDASFRNLWDNPAHYRGQVIHYEGKLRSVRDFDAPLMLAAKGIKQLYECWIFDKDNGANPVCLICPELPAGVKPGEHLSIPVAFDAYFFKKYRYQSVDSTPGHAREAPLFIGRSFVVAQPNAEADATREGFTAGSETLLLIFLGGVFATVLLAFAAHWWLRRGDRRVRARIEVARTHPPAAPVAPSLPPAAPSANLTGAAPARTNDDVLLTRTGPEASD
jgi:hypothetical protein